MTTTATNRPRACVAGLITDPDGRLLLVRTSRGWELPGGGLETGETWREGLRRELAEETGLDVTLSPGDPCVFDGMPVDGAQYQSLIVVARGRASGEPRPAAGDAVREARWFARDALPELSAIATAEVVREWAKTSPGIEAEVTRRAKMLGWPEVLAFHSSWQWTTAKDALRPHVEREARLLAALEREQDITADLRHQLVVARAVNAQAERARDENTRLLDHLAKLPAPFAPEPPPGPRPAVRGGECADCRAPRPYHERGCARRAAEPEEKRAHPAPGDIVTFKHRGMLHVGYVDGADAAADVVAIPVDPGRWQERRNPGLEVSCYRSLFEGLTVIQRAPAPSPDADKLTVIGGSQ